MSPVRRHFAFLMSIHGDFGGIDSTAKSGNYGGGYGKEDALISIEGLEFRYPDGKQVLSGVSFVIRRGEIVSIVGPSGCGKSTLLRLLTRKLHPTNGEIVARGLLKAESDPQRHWSTMVFQEDTVLPWLKVIDNVGLHFRFTRGLFWKRDQELVASAMRLLRMVGLEDYASAFPAQLSGGMRRRVAVLTAVASLPDFLLMDEPFSALDEPTRIDVHEGTYRILREFGISTVLVTHDLGEAISLSDRVLLLSKCPARIVSEYDIPFSKERDVHQLREASEFLDLYGRIWGDLEDQIKAVP